MRRRDFIKFAGGAIAARPLSGQAQQPASPVVGFLSARSADDSKSLIDAFRRGLSDAQFVEGKTVAIEYRWANGSYTRLPALAAELVRLPVAVLVATGGEPAARAAAAATKTVPVVATFAADPVKNGVIASLGRPGGNVTGLTNLSPTMEPKRVGLLRELAPQAKVFGVLVDPNFPSSTDQLNDIKAAADSTGLALDVVRATNDSELETAFDAIKVRQVPALLIASDPFFTTRRTEIAALALERRVPTIYAFHEYAEAGGLMSYGVDLRNDYRQLAEYTARVLKGTKPADLPVLEPTKFELFINLKTAKAIGVTIPPGVLAIADEVIE
jgi:putative tryptophan/tyrosine transport system substrate-binding protein